MSSISASWDHKTLGELAPKPGMFVDGPFGSNLKASEYTAEGVPIARIQNVRPNEFISVEQKFIHPNKADELKRHEYRPGDLVITKMGDPPGDTCIVPKQAGSGIIVADVVRFRGNECETDHKYLSHFLNSPLGRAEFAKFTRGSTRQRVNLSSMKKIVVPLPVISEQRRIAAILDKADAIRRKREQALALADDLLKSTFLEMFGNPVTNPLELDQKPLGKCAEFASGATPSKANSDFWDGTFPWVSPKDMKVDLIEDAQDHVSKLVFEQTNLKKIPANTPLIVVRGMILAHTVPLAMTGREVAINQDMKAIKFDEDIDPTFGFWCLKVQHNEILSRVSTAAHGTKRLDMENLGAIAISLPGENAQKAFVSVVKKFEAMRSGLVNASAEANNCFASLSQRAFRGEL